MNYKLTVSSCRLSGCCYALTVALRLFVPAASYFRTIFNFGPFSILPPSFIEMHTVLMLVHNPANSQMTNLHSRLL